MATSTAAVTTTEAKKMPFTGVPATPEVHDVGVEQDAGRVVEVLVPKITGSRAGMPTSRLMPVTILAVVLVLGMCRNKKKSNASPSAGAEEDHRDDEAQSDREMVALGEQGEDEGRRVGLGGEGEVEDPRRLVGQDEPDREA